MASPSNIPNHPLVQMLDREGDAFPTGSSYFIKNQCSNFEQTLSFSHQIPGATTLSARDEPDSKWWIQYENNDRSRIALKNARTGGYLAVSGTNCKASMYLSEQPTWWYVYAGSSAGTYWLGTSQSPDGFLHTWDCYQGNGAYVGMFTNRDGNWSSFYNMPYSGFEEWGSGMSWGLEPTPELRQWKEQQKANAPSQQQQRARDACCGNCGQECPDVQRAVNEVQNASVGKEEELAKREEKVKAMEDALKEKEQASDDKSKDLEKSEEELKKREEAARAAEERIKKSKKGGKAEHLASQEENDKLKEENQTLQGELQAVRDEMEKLRQQLQQAQQQQQHQARPSDSGRQSLLSGYKAPTIRKPEIKRPGQQLPAVKRPGQTLPGNKKPGQHLPTGYSSDLMKRFEVGKQAMATRS